MNRIGKALLTALLILVAVPSFAQSPSALSLRCRAASPGVNPNGLYAPVWAKCAPTAGHNPALMLRQPGPSEPPTIASTATIAPVSAFFHVSGTSEIATITPPSWCAANYACVLYIMPTGAFTFATSGNIGTTYTATANKLVVLVYDHQTGKWYHD